MYAEIATFCIINSIGIRSILRSTLAWGVLLGIVVVDLTANLSKALNSFTCRAVNIQLPHTRLAYSIFDLLQCRQILIALV